MAKYLVLYARWKSILGISEGFSEYFPADSITFCESLPPHEICDTFDGVFHCGYEFLNEAIERFRCPIIILDLHMLSDFDTEWYSLAKKIFSRENIRIVSTFPRFTRFYEAYGYDDTGKYTAPFLNQVTFVHFPVDSERILSMIWSAECIKRDFVLVPGNHARDYDVFFQTVQQLEQHGIILYYFIIDRSLNEDQIIKYCNRYHISSRIEFQSYLQYDDFLRAIQAARFVFLPLQSDARVCNGLTVFSLVMALGKTLVVNTNETLAPFVENGQNCFMMPWNPDILARMIQKIYNKPQILNTIGWQAKKYAQDQMSLKKFFGELRDIMGMELKKRG